MSPEELGAVLVQYYPRTLIQAAEYAAKTLTEQADSDPTAYAELQEMRSMFTLISLGLGDPGFTVTTDARGIPQMVPSPAHKTPHETYERAWVRACEQQDRLQH